MNHVHHGAVFTVKLFVDITYTERNATTSQRFFKPINKVAYIEEDQFTVGLISLGRHVYYTIYCIIRSRQYGTYGICVNEAVYRGNEFCFHTIFHMLDGIIYVVIVVSLVVESLVVHAEHYVRYLVGLALFHTGGVCLVGNERRLGSEDAHVVDDKVVTVIVSCHIIYAHAEVFVISLLLNREVNLIPLIGLCKVAGHVRGNIFPRGIIQGSLHTEQEVRAGLFSLVARVTHVGGEVHLLSLAQLLVQRYGSHLSGGGHTVAEDHVAVGGTAVLLHLVPVRAERRNAVDQVVLTHVRQVRQAVLVVRTVVGQHSRSGISKAVRCIRPRQRVRINGVIGTRLVVVEVQALKYLKVLLNLVVGDNGCTIFLQLRTILVSLMVNYHIAADIEHVAAEHRFCRIRSTYR